VKIFDMRMLRQVAHLALAIPPPCYVKFLPRNEDLDLNIGVLAVSPNGYIQTVCLTPTYEPIMETLQIQYATLSNSQEDTVPLVEADEVSAVNVSPNGQLIGVGSVMGVLSIHASISSPEETAVVQVNQVTRLHFPLSDLICAPLQFSDPLTIPETHPAPPQYIPIDSPEVATVLTLSNHLLTPEVRTSISLSTQLL
jgi:hypothetical protein